MADYTGALVWWTAALVLVAAFELYYIVRQERWMRESVKAAQGAADAAKLSAEAAIAAQRPWLKVTVSAESNWIVNQIGLSVYLKIIAENFGNSPAVNVWVHSEPWVPVANESPFVNHQELQRRREMIERVARAAQIGTTIFPNESFTFRTGTTIQRANVDAAVRVSKSGKKKADLHVLGMVYYQFAGGAGKSPFHLKVDRLDLKSGLPEPIDVGNDGMIPKEELRFWDTLESPAT